MELSELDGLLTTLRAHGALKFVGFGVDLILGPAPPKVVVKADPLPAQLVPPAPLPVSPTVEDIEKLEAELFEAP